jgi:general secretion pathway protein D
MERTSSSRVSVSTQISSTGQGAVGGEGGGGGEASNSSDTSVNNQSNHSFWQTLQSNIASIIGSPVSGSGETGSLSSHPDILFNRESGILAVRATDRQHREIQGFLSEVMFSSQRQVLIEATIVEVTLSDRFQAGIDWTVFRESIGEDNADVTFRQALTDLTLDNPAFSIAHVGDNLTATVRALDTFGDVSVMSSPKVMTLNNQTALLKVVDNLVYFTVEVNIENSDEGPSLVTYETEVNTVPIGFVMSVTPFINEHGYVTLNIRPTISRVIGQKRDPNPALAEANVVSEIPVIQVREVESMLKIPDGEVAVIGGLMQDEKDNSSQAVPALSKIPVLGNLFKYQDDTLKKSELVIFIKPVVIKSNEDLNPINPDFIGNNWSLR